jgi:tetratricopeptide (TPR) repeat protein
MHIAQPRPLFPAPRREAPDKAAAPRRRAQWLGPVGAFVLSWIAFANSLPNGFTLDDRWIILRNPAVVAPTNVRSIVWLAPWRRPYWPDTNDRIDADVLYRPLTVQTYAWEMRLWGPRPLGFHVTNVALHAVVSVIVCLVASRLCQSSLAGLVIGWIFAVHPIHTEAVANVVGRAEILAAGGVFGALLAFDSLLRAPSRSARAALGLAAIAAGAIAILSKESGVAVIPMIVAWAWFRAAAPTRPQRLVSSTALVAVVLFAVFAGYLTARYHVCGQRLRVAEQLTGAGNILRDETGAALMMTPVALLGRYVALTIWPARLLADYSYAVVLPTHSVLDGYFTLGALALIGGAGATVLSIRGRRAGAVAVAGFVTSYTLVSNAFVLLGTLMAERWFYAPSAWLLILFGMAAQRAMGWPRLAARITALRSAAWPRVGFAAVLLALTVRTAWRNPAWRDNQSLYESDLAATEPGRRSAVFLSFLGNLYTSQGQYQDAEALAREAVETYPENPAVQATLARVLLATNRPSEALAVLNQAQRMAPSNAEVAALRRQAEIRAQGVDLEASLRKALDRVAEQPRDAQAHQAVGYFLEALGRLGEAAAAYRRAAELDPEAQDAWLAWARTLAAQNRPREAITAYETILAKWPNAWQAHANLATQLMQENLGPLYQPQRAVEHAERALALAPESMQETLKLNLAEVCAHCGQPDRAIALFEARQRSLPPDDPQRRRLQARIDFLRSQR